MTDIVANNASKRPVFVDPSKGTLFTTNPATGGFAPIIDPVTGKPMTKRPLFVDPETGRYCAVDVQTGRIVSIIDPATGEPMTSELPTIEKPKQAEPEWVFDEKALAMADSTNDDTPPVAQDGEVDYNMSMSELAAIIGAPAATNTVEARVTPNRTPQPLASAETVPNAASPTPHAIEPNGPAGVQTPPGEVLPPEALANMQAEVAALRAQVDAKADVHTSGAAVAALVLGILAILTCLIPVANYVSGALAIIALVLAIIGRAGVRKGKVHGKGMTTAGTILSVVAIVVVIATQFFYGRIVENIMSRIELGPAPVAAAAGCSHTDFSNMKPGESVALENGLTITVERTQKGLSRMNGEPITSISVAYAYNGTSNYTYDALDWKATTASGEVVLPTSYPRGENNLGAGTLAPGGKASGNLYFAGDVTKVNYYSRALQSASEIGWAVD